MQTVHDIGAGLFFILGNVYAWIQVGISYRMRKFGLVTSCVCAVRTIVSVISSLSVVAFLILSSCARRLWNGNKLHWDSNDPGYTVHVIGNAFEWLLVLNFLILVLTFTKELCYTKLDIKLVGCGDGYEPIPASTC